MTPMKPTYCVPLLLAIVMLASPGAMATNFLHPLDSANHERPTFRIGGGASEALVEATDNWEATTDRDVFHSSGRYDIRVVFKAVDNQERAAWAGMAWNPTEILPDYCFIGVDSGFQHGGHDVLVDILTHEIGHCLGLPHEDGTIMQSSGIVGMDISREQAFMVDNGCHHPRGPC